MSEIAMGHQIDANRTVLTSAEASNVSGLTRTHINYLIHQGRLDAIRVGNNWLVYEDSLRRYVAEPRKPGPKAKTTEPAGDSSMPETAGKQG